MTITFRKRSSGDRELGIIFGSITLLALCATRLLPVAALMPSCIFRELTTIPCPACGATRAVVHFAHFDIIPALLMNPLMTTTIALSLVALLAGLISAVLKTPRIVVSMTTREGDALRIGAILAVSVQWLYLYLRN